MRKWGWRARFAKIEEACIALNDQDDMPVWDDLTLDDALEIARDVAELFNEENGSWDYPYEKAQYRKAMKFIADFGKSKKA